MVGGEKRKTERPLGVCSNWVPSQAETRELLGKSSFALDPHMDGKKEGSMGHHRWHHEGVLHGHVVLHHHRSVRTIVVDGGLADVVWLCWTSRVSAAAIRPQVLAASTVRVCPIPERELDKLAQEAKRWKVFLCMCVSWIPRKTRERGVIIARTETFSQTNQQYTVIEAPGHRAFIEP